MLAGAALLAASLRRELAVAPGFEPTQILTVQIGLTSGSYREEKDRLVLSERRVNELPASPGISDCAISNSVPFAGEAERTIITVEGHALQPGESTRGYDATSARGD
jgi:hypothetical protein